LDRPATPNLKPDHRLSGHFVSAKKAFEMATKKGANEQQKVGKFIKDFEQKINQVI
jgi:hypothetical protein